MTKQASDLNFPKEYRYTKAHEWAKVDGALTAGEAGRALTVKFTGNRIDLIGMRTPEGGSAAVWIDETPADRAEVFYAGYIKPDEKNAPAPPNPPRDRAPHRVGLGTKLVPQSWTIRMVSDTGDYELTGSVTGLDGKGNARQPFTSTSGQIGIEPEFWRLPETNRTGDTFTFDVWRGATGTANFRGEPGKFRLTLVQNLPNAPHVLRLRQQGKNAV